MEKYTCSKKIKNLFAAFIVGGVVIVICRRIFVNVHIDEEIIVSMGYRVLQKHCFFTQIQEPQILLAPLIALIEVPYLLILGTTGIFVYMKTVMSIILVCTTIFVFRKIRNEAGLFPASMTALICFFFHFRYVNVADYTFLYDVFSIILVLQIVTINRTDKNLVGKAIVIAASNCIMVLSLPSGVLLFPICILLLRRKDNGEKICLLILCLCIFGALLECLILLHGHSFVEVPSLIHNLVSNSTYMKNNRNLWIKFAQSAVILFCFASMLKKPAVTLPFKEKQEFRKIGGGIGVVLVIYGLVSMIITTVIELQFYAKQGYYMVLLGGFFLTVFYEEREDIRIIFYYGILSDIAASLVTHYETCGAYALPAIVATILMLLNFKLGKNKLVTPPMMMLLVVIFILFEGFSKDIIMISNNAHNGDTIFNQELLKIDCGPAKGCYARKVEVDKYNEIYSWIIDNIDRNVKVCYFGRNVLLYMMSDKIDACVPQLFGDYSGDDVLIEYYAKFPEEVPDFVITDISPTSKRLMADKEKVLIDGYSRIYKSENYLIYER